MSKQITEEERDKGQFWWTLRRHPQMDLGPAAGASVGGSGVGGVGGAGLVLPEPSCHK